MPRRSASAVASGMVAGNASATWPSMLTRTRLGWSIDNAVPPRCAASAAAASDCIARAAPTGGGLVSATSASVAPRIHSATTIAPGAARTTCSTRPMPGMSSRLSDRVRDTIAWICSSGSLPSGSTKVSATCRCSVVSRACQNCRCSKPPCQSSSR